MKKEELKNEFDNVQISSTEKAKIFNNIMEKKNKKQRAWIPFVGLGTVALASIGAYILVNGDSRPTNELKDNGNNNVLKEDIVMTGDMSMESYYRKEILVQSPTYLSNNKIDLSTLKDGESKVINASEIVGDSSEYKTCTGKLTITKYDSDYTYSTSVDCGGTKDGRDVEFKIYKGDLLDVYELNNGFITISRVNPQYNVEHNEEIANNLNITRFNTSGDIVWSTVYNYKNENSMDMRIRPITVTDIEDGNVLINFEYAYNFMFYGSGSSSHNTNTYSVLFDKDGKIKEVLSVKDKENAMITIDKYIGGSNGTYYYSGSVFNSDETNQTGIFIYKNNEMTFKEFNFFVETTDEYQITRNFMAAHDNYLYGYLKKKGLEPGILETNTIFKMDLDGNVVWEYKIDVGEEKDFFIHEMVILNNEELYIKGNVRNEGSIESGDSLVYRYVHKIKEDKETDILTLVDYTEKEEDSQNMVVSDLKIKDNYLVINYYNNNTQVNYVYKQNLKDSTDKIIREVSVEGLNDKFDYSYLYASIVDNNVLAQVYSVKQNLSDEILLVFYK